MGTPEAAEDRLDGHQLTFGRRVDLQAAPNVNADVGDPVVRIGVCNRWAKNATIGIDRGTGDWLRDDARVAGPNTYGSFCDAANRGNRLVDARRTVVIANGASRHRRGGRNGSARLRCTQLRNGVNPNGENLIAEPAEDSHERQVLVVCPSSISRCTTRTG